MLKHVLYWFLMFTALLSAAKAATIFDSENSHSQTEIEDARNRIIQLIAEANSNGVVELKGAEIRQSHESGHAAADGLAEDNDIDATSADTTLSVLQKSLATLDCIDPGLYAADKSAETNGNSIRKLLDAANATDGVARREIEYILAWSYLRLGFYSEAASIAVSAANRDDPRFHLVYDFAALGDARADHHYAALTQVSDCTETMNVLNVAGVINAGRASKDTLETISPNALSGAMRSIVAPVAESIALFALNSNDQQTAFAFYKAAHAARDGKRSPALDILHVALDTQTNADEADRSKVADIAQRPSPHQEMAVAALVGKTPQHGEETYEGLIDDFLALENGTPNENAAINGANALVEQDFIADAIDILIASITRNGEQNDKLLNHTRETISELISQGDGAQKFAAISAYLTHQNVLADHQLTMEVASAIADIGDVALTKDILAKSPALDIAEQNRIIAYATAKAGDPSEIINQINAASLLKDNAVEAVVIYERLNDKHEVAKIISGSLAAKVAPPTLSDAAWRTGDPSLAMRAYGQIPESVILPAQARRHALAALSSNSSSSFQEAITRLPEEDRAALTHMAQEPGAFSTRRSRQAKDFVEGVDREIEFFRKEIGRE
ncbi:MAG: hypothetical protein AAGD92_06965 [Pseudomonadota bacterium]